MTRTNLSRKNETKRIKVHRPAFLIALLIILVLSLSACNSDDGINVSKGDGKWGLSFKTTDIDGLSFTHEKLAENKLTVVNVWATWCPPCIKELPELEKVNNDFASKGVQVLGVLADGVDEKGKKNQEVINTGSQLLSDANAHYAVVIPDESLQTKLINQMQYFPTTFFLNSKGEIIHQVVGSKDYNGWSGEIDAVLKELE